MSGSLTLSLSQISIDASLEVVTSSGTIVASSANLSANASSLDVDLVAGAYYVRVASTSRTFSQYTFGYQFEQTSLSIDSAILIQSGSTTANSIVANSEDLYRVDLTVPSRLDLKLDGLSANADLQVFDSSGNAIDSSTNLGTTPDLVMNNLNPGTYYVRVSLADGAGTTNYQLSYNLYDLPLFALSNDNRLVALDPNLNEPGKLLAFVDIKGLAPGETMEAIDFRPGSSELYGLSTADNLYTVNLTTGAATRVGSNPLNIAGSAVGFDFDPSSNSLRVVSETGENDRIDPITGAIVGTDGVLTYAAGDSYAGFKPTVTAAAYSNNAAGTGATTLYGIDTALDVLVVQNSRGKLSTVGGLGVDFDAAAGFDIFTAANGANTGYATSKGNVYAVNLTTGAATTLTGVVDSGNGIPYNLVGVAVQPA